MPAHANRNKDLRIMISVRRHWALCVLTFLCCASAAPGGGEPKPATAQPSAALPEVPPGGDEPKPAVTQPSAALPEAPPGGEGPKPATAQPSAALPEAPPGGEGPKPAVVQPSAALPEAPPGGEGPKPAVAQPSAALPEAPPGGEGPKPAVTQPSAALPEAPPGGDEPKPAVTQPSAALPEAPPGGEEPKPAAAQPAPIRAKDWIRIVMEEDARVRFEGSVDEDGVVSLPYLGAFSVAGMTEEQCSRAVAEALERDLYYKATVSTRMLKRPPGEVQVHGYVNRPGVVPLPQGGRLPILYAVSLAGGCRTGADREKCLVLRTDPITGKREKLRIDLDSQMPRIGGAGEFLLVEEDVVYVPPTAKKRATVKTPLAGAPQPQKPRAPAPPPIPDGLLAEPAVADLARAASELQELPQPEQPADGGPGPEPGPGREVIVLGQVETQGLLSFGGGEPMTLLRLILKAGGFSSFAKKNAVRLIRYDADGNRTERVIDAAEIFDEGRLEADVPLEPGDLVIVPQKAINF